MASSRNSILVALIQGVWLPVHKLPEVFSQSAFSTSVDAYHGYEGSFSLTIQVAHNFLWISQQDKPGSRLFDQLVNPGAGDDFQIDIFCSIF